MSHTAQSSTGMKNTRTQTSLALFLAHEAGKGVRKNMTMALALTLTVMISLSLFGVGLLVQKQVHTMKDYWYDKVELSVFLCGKTSPPEVCSSAVSEQQRDNIREVLTETPGVASIYYESSEEAYSHFAEQFKNSPILASVKPDDLPESFRVKLTNPDEFSNVNAVVSELAGVEQVRDQKALLVKFFGFLTGLQTVSMTIAVAMLAVTILLISNTVRLAAYSRRKETAVMKLVGASNISVALPFVLETVIAAVAGGLASVGVLFGIQHFVIEGRLTEAYSNTNFVSWTDVFGVSVLVFFVGVAIVAGASSVSVKRYLSV